MVNAVNTALQGLVRAQEDLAQSAERVSRDGTAVDALVDFKLDERNVEVQARSLKSMLDTEDRLLEILA